MSKRNKFLNRYNNKFIYRPYGGLWSMYKVHRKIHEEERVNVNARASERSNHKKMMNMISFYFITIFVFIYILVLMAMIHLK